MRLPTVTAIAAMLTLTSPGLARAAADTHQAAVPARIVATQVALRDLWLGHIFWVRNVVEARLANNAAAAKTAEEQVVDNARAIAGAIEPYYGKPASEKLFGLLAGHWGAIRAYLDATQARDKSAQDAAFDKLVGNAGEISTFLGGANPHLPVDTLRGLLSTHGAHHVDQIKQLKTGEYDQEARTWAAMKDHIYAIADALANGIAKQFPDKFR